MLNLAQFVGNVLLHSGKQPVSDLQKLIHEGSGAASEQITASFANPLRGEMSADRKQIKKAVNLGKMRGLSQS